MSFLRPHLPISNYHLESVDQSRRFTSYQLDWLGRRDGLLLVLLFFLLVLVAIRFLEPECLFLILPFL